MLTWDDLSPQEKAAYMMLSPVRTQKHATKRPCCLCKRSILSGQSYQQHAGHMRRLAHAKCVIKYGTGVAPRVPEKRQTAKKMYTQIQLDKAKYEAFQRGFQQGMTAS